MTETASNYDGTHPERTIAAAAAILAPVFAQNGWTWTGSGVPTEEEIAKTITELTGMIQNDIVLSATGRIVVAADPYPDSFPDQIHLYLDLGTIYTKAQV